MSHTSTLKGITINNLEAIRASVDMLRSQGVNIELVENAKPRAYYQNQDGMTSPAELVLKLNDAKYDVGLYARGDGSYDMRFDAFAGIIAKEIGDSAIYKQNADTGSVCRFTSEYATQVAIQTAVSRGLSAQRSVNERGETVIVVTGV